MRVYNIDGNSGASTVCPCGSWLQHWLAFNVRHQKKLPKTCAVLHCMNAPEVGTFVQESAGYNLWQIVPLCGFHSHQKDRPLDLVKSVSFCSIQRSETCEKKTAVEG
jgi:hypothetical protein